uniref:Tudor domain-containing protein n=2 Tax=Ascaris lumbricoides TaxID=6252 RepID=A0A0M3I536_ASCLU
MVRSNANNNSIKTHNFFFFLQRVPTWQANLERYFNVTWCISEETPVRIGYENGKGISSPTSHALCSTFETVDEKSTKNWEHVQEFPGSAVNENDFPGTGTGRFFRSESSVTVSCSDGMSANSWKFSSKRFPSKWTSDVGSDKTAAEKFAANSLPLDTTPLSLLPTMNCQMSSLRNDSEENRLVGIVTAFHARVGFLWCPELGEVIITMANVAMSLKHGDWVSFIPRGTNEGRLKFMAQWIRKIPQLYHAEQFANSVMVETVVFLSADYSASDSLFHAEYFGDAFDDKGVVRRFVQENGLYDALLVGLTKQNPLKFYGQSWKIAKVIRPIEVSSWTRTQESSAVQKGFSSCTSQHYDSNLTDEVQKSLRL